MGAIVGGTVGGLVILAILLSTILFTIRRHSRSPPNTGKLSMGLYQDNAAGTPDVHGNDDALTAGRAGMEGTALTSRPRIGPDGQKMGLESVLGWRTLQGVDSEPSRSFTGTLSRATNDETGNGRSSGELTELMRRVEMLEAERRLLPPPSYALDTI